MELNVSLLCLKKVESNSYISPIECKNNIGGTERTKSVWQVKITILYMSKSPISILRILNQFSSQIFSCWVRKNILVKCCQTFIYNIFQYGCHSVNKFVCRDTKTVNIVLWLT